MAPMPYFARLILGIEQQTARHNLARWCPCRDSNSGTRFNGAHASFEETIKGSLEVGKLADIVELSGPVLGESIENVRSMQVEMTVMDGKITYDTGITLPS